MADSLHWRWLGVAGVALEMAGSHLVIDPFFTRPPFHRLWLGRVSPDEALAERMLPRCDVALVSHAHYDHLMDIPAITRHTGAGIYASPNACRLLAACGVPEGRINPIGPGAAFGNGQWQVRVMRGQHVPVVGYRPGPLPRRLEPPLRLRDYRMDEQLCYLVEAGGVRVLHWGSIDPAGAPRADLLFTGVTWPSEALRVLLQAVQPRLVVPIHWDDLFRPLSRPIRPFLAPPSRQWPFIRRMHPQAFARRVSDASAGITGLVAEVGRRYAVA